MSDGPFAGYADLSAHLAGAPVASFVDADAQRLAAVLGVRRSSTDAPVVRIEREWHRNGVHGRAVSWSVGFGPRTRAFMLEPVDHDGDLPGLIGMHCHGGVRSTGAEQLVVTDTAPHPRAAHLRRQYYADGAVANDLARAGFAVLVHDVFSWGSRAFDLARPTGKLAVTADALDARARERGETPTTDERFDALSTWHEDALAKGLGVLGTSLAGMVAADDLVAVDVLGSWDSVDATRLGTFGLSGGGGRALFAAALDPRIRATVVACMMATNASLVPDYLDAHSWLLHSPGLAAWRDLPDIAAMTAGDLMVQYGARDPLFPATGVTDADSRLRAVLGERYTGAFYDAGHEWSRTMQSDAADFLQAALHP